MREADANAGRGEAVGGSPIDAVELGLAWRSWLVEHNRVGMRGALWLVVFLYPAFGVLDYLVASSDALPLLWGMRLLVTLYTVVMLGVIRTEFFTRQAMVLSSIYVVVIASGIAVMLSTIGGLASPYYAGLNLVMVGAGLLFVWPRAAVIATYGTIVAAYLLPNLTYIPSGEATAAISNVFFFVSMAIVIAAGQILNYRAQYAQLVTRLTLERTKSDLEKTHERLKDVDRYRTRFFANITHELRTPLTLILSPVDAILQGQVGGFSADQAEYLRGIQRNAMRLLRLINDILDLTKLEESHVRLDIVRIDIQHRLDDIIRIVQPLAERKGIIVQASGDPSPDDIWVDAEQFERIIINLLSNAIKFTPAGGSVSVVLLVALERVTVVVEDTGEGIPPDQISRVFDRFTQVDDSTTRRHGGTGLGLALVRELVELHGGEIRAESRVGEGTRMIVTLRRGSGHFGEDIVRAVSSEQPQGLWGEGGAGEAHLAVGAPSESRGLTEWMEEIRGSESYRFLEIDAQTERRVVPRDPEERLKTHKVLVIDDNRDMLEFLQFQLHGQFRVYAAQDGEKGWEIIQRDKPDIIVSDYMMPGIDGIDLCARVKADPETCGIPFVLLSAKAEVEDRVRGHEAGADVYLAKPFQPRELRAIIDSHIQAGEAMADALLEKRMQSIDLLSAGLAHEIRNPLTYIQNGMFLLQKTIRRWTELDPDDEAGRAKLQGRLDELFEVAEKGVKRIDGIVELIKQYAQEGATVVERAYAVDDAIRKTLPLLAPYRPKAVSIHQDLRAKAQILIVPEQLHQVLTGLVQNALDAVPEAGNVWVATEREGENVRLTVRDDGPGIPEDVRSNIFSPFFSTKAPGEGMGLGLTIVHRVVTRAGGTITVDSAADGGTLFTVMFPVFRGDV